MIPSLLSSALKLVPTDTESITTSTAMLFIRFCSLSEMPSLPYISRSFGSTSSRLPSGFSAAWALSSR
jgi:hypothetical protein